VVWRLGALRRWPAREPKASSTAAVERIASLLLLILSGMVVACAVIGLVVVGWNDNRRTSERHAALRLALDEVHAVFGQGDRFENGRLRLIERRAGLKDLHFGTDPPAAGDREVNVLEEGVETDEQRVLLRLAGCDELQGHLFAMPAPAGEIEHVWTRPMRPAKLPAVAAAS